jgi:integrase
VLPPKPAPRERWLTRSEVAKLLWAARKTPHLARFILVGIYTGTRPGAILNLQWDWIDFVRGVMHRRGEGEIETKKRRPPVRLGRKIAGHLKRWRRMDNGSSEYVVHYPDGRPMRYLTRPWQQLVKRAGLDSKIVPHTLRHTRATWLMQSGTVSVWEAAGQLGMSPTILEQVYGHWSPDFGKRAAEV